MNRKCVDVAIIGSGFSGSLLAWILAKQGLQVALIDKAKHPRFAIGESSTPIADLILRQLGESYGLPPLIALSRWGTWQQHFPHLGCGLKRGFTYFQHRPQEACFCEHEPGSRSMWVAASPDDAVSDTHWYRPEVDTFLHQQAIASGVIDCSGMVVEELSERESSVTLRCAGESSCQVKADFVVDATGQAAVTAKLRGLTNYADQLRTHTYATFAHFTGVRSWSRSSGHQLDLEAVPFDADDSAQHHLIGDAWVWMLRFQNGITSVGVTGTRPQRFDWSRLPVLQSLMKDARQVAPVIGQTTSPRSTARLQRWFDPWISTASMTARPRGTSRNRNFKIGSRVIMMPTSSATLDPLHSTGIAHGLAGVQRLAKILMGPDSERIDRLQEYRSVILREVRFLDALLSTAYATMSEFDRFTHACMAYFVAAIACEEDLQQGKSPQALWNIDDQDFCHAIARVNSHLLSDKPLNPPWIRQWLRPWNRAGLFDPQVANRYAYTATKT